jgi:DNA-directed RNA polymerase III subunit RPC2
MGITADFEIVQLVSFTIDAYPYAQTVVLICSTGFLLQVCGNNEARRKAFALNLEECSRLGIYSRLQALDYIGQRAKAVGMRRTGPGIGGSGGFQARKPWSEEAMEVLATVVLAHVPVENFNFRDKAIYVAMMVRRVLMAVENSKMVDDRDYVGNKRLEL